MNQAASNQQMHPACLQWREGATVAAMALRSLLESFHEAFNNRKIAAATDLFADRALFEMPLLGGRLMGKQEIAAGLARMFEVTSEARLSLSAVRDNTNVAIAEGMLAAKLHRDPLPVSMPLALSLEVEKDLIARLSFYLDARPYRLWTDGPILAPTRLPGIS